MTSTAAAGRAADLPRSRGVRQLIVNADDLGLTSGVNRGIWEAFEAGSVTAASLMANTPGSDDAIVRIRRSRRAPDGRHLDVGLHVNLTTGAPLTSGVSTLVDPRSGTFRSLPALVVRAVTGRLDRDEIAAECAAQLARVRDAGVAVSHVDSHRHVHLLPVVWGVVVETAVHAGIPHVRVPVEPLSVPGETLRSAVTKLALRLSAPDVPRGTPHGPRCHFRGTALLHASHYLDDFLRLVGALPDGCTELMVHPGYADEELAALDTYTLLREREVRALTAPETVARLWRGDVQLRTFTSSAAPP